MKKRKKIEKKIVVPPRKGYRRHLLEKNGRNTTSYVNRVKTKRTYGE